MHNLLSYIQTILSPPYCAYCLTLLEHRTPLCKECRTEIVPVLPHILQITEQISMPVFACGAYSGPLKYLIHAKQKQYIAGTDQLGILLAEYIASCSISADILVPIPLHWLRYAIRGYNQADRIAQKVGTYIQKPVMPLIRKHTYTSPQKFHAAHTRAYNIAGSFSLNAPTDLPKGLHIVLIDDVMTTGETLYAAARTLLPLRPASVQAFVAARVM